MPSVIGKRRRSIDIEDKRSGHSFKSIRNLNISKSVVREIGSSKKATPSTEKGFSYEARLKILKT